MRNAHRNMPVAVPTERIQLNMWRRVYPPSTSLKTTTRRVANDSRRAPYAESALYATSRRESGCAAIDAPPPTRVEVARQPEEAVPARSSNARAAANNTIAVDEHPSS